MFWDLISFLGHVFEVFVMLRDFFEGLREGFGGSKS